MLQADLEDIQGLVLRGYRKPTARHLLLRIGRAEPFRALLGALASEELDSGPYVTVAADWTPKPPAGVPPAHCVNIGFTFDGLRALGLPAESLATFPVAFREGAARRAAKVGDSGPSAPRHWRPSLTSPDAHVLLSVFADDGAALERVSADLRARVAAAGAAEELDHLDGQALPGEVTHFGYRDGLSQPTIDGAPMAGLRDPLPPVPAGDIVLGHPSARVDFAYPVPQPEPLGRNGSFGAFRVLAQDVAGFHRFLDDEAAALGIDRELLAAKVCGRWRNGVPVLMSPDTATPDPAVPHDRLNDFDYVRTAAQQEFDDPRGDVCPVGSHIRRANPRNARVAGSGLKRRIVRRGLTYGPPYDPALPDHEERGLVGMFIGADLQEGFEFVVGEWLNGGTFAAGLDGSKDVLAGANEATDSRFVVSRRPRVAVSGFSRFVTTRGAAYCFLPSMTGLRVLAGGG